MRHFVTETLREKYLNTEVISGPYSPAFGMNTGNYGQGKNPYLDTFHAVKLLITECMIAMTINLFFN